MTAIKPRTRNASVKSAGRTPVTPSKTTFSLMVKVGHTNAPSLVLTANKDFSLDAVTVDTRNGEKFADTSVKVLAGTDLILVASSFPGLYYIGRVSHGNAGCTCPSFQNRHTCKHQPEILAVHVARFERWIREDAAEFGYASAAIESDDAEDLLDEDSKIEKWTKEALANVAPETPTTRSQVAPDFASMTPEERRAFWKGTTKRENQRENALRAPYWASAHALRQQSTM